MNAGTVEEVAEPRPVRLCIELILGGVLRGRNKDNGLIESSKALHALLALHDSLLQLLYAFLLFLTFLDVALGNCRGRLCQHVEIHQDLIASLLLVNVVNWQVEVVLYD